MRRRPCQADSLSQAPTRSLSPGRFPRARRAARPQPPGRAARGRDRAGHAALAEPAAQRAEGLGVRSDCGRLTVKTPRHRRPTRQGEKRGAAPGSGAHRMPDPSPGLAPGSVLRECWSASRSHSIVRDAECVRDRIALPAVRCRFHSRAVAWLGVVTRLLRCRGDSDQLSARVRESRCVRRQRRPASEGAVVSRRGLAVQLPEGGGVAVRRRVRV